MDDGVLFLNQKKLSSLPPPFLLAPEFRNNHKREEEGETGKHPPPPTDDDMDTCIFRLFSPFFPRNERGGSQTRLLCSGQIVGGDRMIKGRKEKRGDRDTDAAPRVPRPDLKPGPSAEHGTAGRVGKEEEEEEEFY